MSNKRKLKKIALFAKRLRCFGMTTEQCIIGLQSIAKAIPPVPAWMKERTVSPK